jgi:hypothetical protein
MRNTFEKWWEGELEPRQNDPHSDLFTIGPGSYTRHWTSSAAHWAVEFYMRGWKWTLGTAAAITGELRCPDLSNATRHYSAWWRCAFYGCPNSLTFRK